MQPDLLRRAAGWLFAPGSSARLAALRIGLCAVLAARLSRGIYLELAGQPAALFRPLSFTHLLPGMPPRGAVLALQVLGVAAAVLAAAGVRARLTLPAAWAAGLFLNGLHTSIGKVMHNDVLLLLAMVPLLPAPVSDAWALHPRGAPDRVSARHGWPVRTSMAVVAGAYFFAGLAKVVNSGPAWVLSDSMRWILYASSDSQPSPNPVALFLAGEPLLARGLAAVTLVLELGFPLALARPRLRWLFVPGAVALHAGTWLAMRLDYAAWIATVVVVFVDWPAVVARVRSRSLRRGQRATGAVR